MSMESDYHDFMREMYAWQEKQKKQKVHSTTVIRNRKVKYVEPGHTIVYYPHRTLHIYFKESKASFDKKAKLRRRHSAQNGQPKKVDDSVYVDFDQNGKMIYVSASGRDVTDRVKTSTARGKNRDIGQKLMRDKYTTEDMRALLRDDHWEEVCGNRRWNYDPKATVREFNKYLKWKNIR